ncbi:hypothetical protein GCM10023328_26570 [Modestobacter marinus]
MWRTVSEALRTAVRMASSTLVVELPTISLRRYTWSLTTGLLDAGLPGRQRSASTLARPGTARERDGAPCPD